MRGAPGIATLAMLTIAVGIAANSTVFSWINATLLNPIPGVADTGQMVTVMRGERSEHPTPPFSYEDFTELRDTNKSFAGLLAYHDDFVALTGAEPPERVYAALTSANYFDVLGVRPILGRGFLAAEEKEGDGAGVAVLGYDLWQNRFAGDPHIVGKQVHVNLRPYTIVGVAPKGFQGCKTGLRAELWIPLTMDRAVWGSNRLKERWTNWLNVLGRLEPGVERRQAESEMNLLMQGIAERYPASHLGPNEISMDPLWRSPFGANVYLYGTLPILLVLAATLLLLACANVANLLLVRSVGRRREIALRLSMGASRWRIVRQLLVESVMISLAASGVAILLTKWTAGSFSAFFPPTSLPLTLNGHVDGTVLGATVLIAVVTAALSGILPALRTSLMSPVAVLKDESASASGGLRTSRLSGGLVVAQIALSFLLLICAGLFVRSLEGARKFDPGFDPNHMLVASFDLDAVGYTRDRGIEFQKQAVERVKEIPGVESATIADFSPLSFTLRSDDVQPEGYVSRRDESLEIDRGATGSNYLKTLRTPLRAGRDFNDQDTSKSQPVAIVNQAMVDRFWPGQEALGRRIQVHGVWFTVVGVAANGKYRRLSYGAAPLVLVPMAQRYANEAILQVRVAGDPEAYAGAVERAVHGLNPNLPVYNVTPMSVTMKMGSIFERIAAAFAGSFGLISLILAAVGIYGVVSYTTKQRTREFGIRMALGAQRSDVLRTVLGSGARMTIAGLVLGAGAAAMLTRFLRGMLIGVGTTDATTFGMVGLLLCGVALVACYLPARRATRIEPMRALRYE